MERKNLFRLSGKILLTVFILILYIKFGIATTGCIQCSSGEVCSGNTGTPDCTVSDSQTVVLGNGLKIFNFGTLTIQNSKILTFERNDEAPEEFGGGSGGAGGAGSGGQAGGTGEDGCNKLKGNTGSYGDEKAGADVKFTANTFNLYGTLKSVGEGGRNGATNPAPPDSQGWGCTDSSIGGTHHGSRGDGGGGGGSFEIEAGCMNIDGGILIDASGGNGGNGGSGTGDTDECGWPCCIGCGEPSGGGGGGGGGDGGDIIITITNPSCSNLEDYTLTKDVSGGGGGTGGAGGVDSESGCGNAGSGSNGGGGSSGTYTLNYNPCNSNDFDSSNSYFVIKNNAGTEIAKIDQNGMMIIEGELKSWSTGYDSTHDFLIKDNGGTVKSWINDATGDLYLSGSLYTVTSASPSSSGNFVIKDSGGNPEAWFKDDGSLYLKSCLAVAASCAPATCASLGYTCGTYNDGCGGTISCGSCAGNSCSGDYKLSWSCSGGSCSQSSYYCTYGCYGGQCESWDGSCFLEGTKIKTQKGEKAIEKIQQGDIVYSYDTETDRLVGNVVNKLLVHENYKDEGVILTLSNNEKIYVTVNHLFYSASDGIFKELRKFKDNELLSYYNKIMKKMESITIKRIDPIGSFDVSYNLELDKEPRNYFANNVLVHNDKEADCDPDCDP